MPRHRDLPSARYDYGGDELVFVELDRVMSLEASLKALALAQELQRRAPGGIIEVAPANCSCLIRFRPDRLRPADLIDELKSIELSLGDLNDVVLATRIVELPVLYQDPWTAAAQLEWRDRHPSPEETDLEFAARVTGHASVDAFVESHSEPVYLVSMVGFMPGLPWCYPLVAEQPMDVPKYNRPRTVTPERAIGQGGRFAVIYPSPSAGNHQLLGMTPAPIYDPSRKLADFADGPTLFRPGDLVRFRRIDHEEFLRDRAAALDGSFRHRLRQVDLIPGEILANPGAFSRRLLELAQGD